MAVEEGHPKLVSSLEHRKINIKSFRTPKGRVGSMCVLSVLYSAVWV